MSRKRHIVASSVNDVYTNEEFAFIRAIDAYKAAHHYAAIGWDEVLKIAHSLGYRKVAEETELPTYEGGK